MEFVIVLIGGCLIFAVCFAALYLKSLRSKEPVKLHMCGQGDDCQCSRDGQAQSSFDLPKVLEQAARLEGADAEEKPKR